MAGLLIVLVWALLATKRFREQQMLIRQLMAEREVQVHPTIYIQQGRKFYRIELVGYQIWCERRQGQNRYVKNNGDYDLPVFMEHHWDITMLHHVIADYESLLEQLDEKVGAE